MKKTVTAVAPYIYKGGLNFKNKPFEAWRELGLPTVRGWYPRQLHKLMFNVDMPTLWQGEARLVFVQPVSLYFDTFFTAMPHEMIPFIWDCWPKYDDRAIGWLKFHRVKTCIFTCKQAAERIQNAIPNLNVLVIPEGLDTERYKAGKELKDRSIDLYTYGRLKESLLKKNHPSLHIERNGDFKTLLARIQDAKVTIALPRCDVEPELTGGQETLTQRYWECMLSRMVMVGRTPKELVDFIGYNPVIDIDYENYEAQIKDIVAHIESYQELVDKNREVALRMAPWEIRMKQVMEWLTSLGYEV